MRDVAIVAVATGMREGELIRKKKRRLKKRRDLLILKGILWWGVTDSNCRPTD